MDRTQIIEGAKGGVNVILPREGNRGGHVRPHPLNAVLQAAVAGIWYVIKTRILRLGVGR